MIVNQSPASLDLEGSRLRSHSPSPSLDARLCLSLAILAPVSRARSEPLSGRVDDDDFEPIRRKEPVRKRESIREPVPPPSSAGTFGWVCGLITAAGFDAPDLEDVLLTRLSFLGLFTFGWSSGLEVRGTEEARMSSGRRPNVGEIGRPLSPGDDRRRARR
jgi:hypothetical protein